MMALRTVMPDAPDLILSGVNRGANLADDITYSGTVSAAIEGALAGIRSIAFSQVYAREGMGDDVPFGAAREWGAKVLRPADRRADGRPHAHQRQLPRPARPTTSRASASCARASTITRAAPSSKGAIRAAIAISGSGSTRSSTRWITAPTLKRSRTATSR